jgi:hypothetical protein
MKGREMFDRVTYVRGWLSSLQGFLWMVDHYEIENGKPLTIKELTRILQEKIDKANNYLVGLRAETQEERTTDD